MKTLQDALREAAPALGYKIVAKPAKTPRPKKCKVCGGDMTGIAGTNVWVCRNIVEKTKTKKEDDGTVTEYQVTEPCDHRLVALVR